MYHACVKQSVKQSKSSIHSGNESSFFSTPETKVCRLPCWYLRTSLLAGNRRKLLQVRHRWFWLGHPEVQRGWGNDKLHLRLLWMSPRQSPRRYPRLDRACEVGATWPVRRYLEKKFKFKNSIIINKKFLNKEFYINLKTHVFLK